MRVLFQQQQHTTTTTTTQQQQQQQPQQQQQQNTEPASVAAPSPPPPSASKKTLVVAKADFNGNPDKQQLSLRKGEEFELLDDTKKWWIVKNHEGKEGKVPSNFVKIVQ
eukprot:m.114739 g.114739  ORF g.114739 m.114739 type:complete len:109 (+) comp14177_c1_seq5:5676-6002(+)